jgi:hypothetical protein
MLTHNSIKSYAASLSIPMLIPVFGVAAFLSSQHIAFDGISMIVLWALETYY